jgi:Uma2 family endonuclease
MTQPTSSSAAPPPGSPEDPFRYGWRYVKRVLPDGRVELDQVPLTLEDTLHPEEEDEIPVRSLHQIHCRFLADVLEDRPLPEPVWQVTADLRIDWGVEGIRPHSPDIAVFVGLREPIDIHAGTFYLANSGGRCVLAIEVVSVDRRNNDVVHKFNHYHRVGIPLYLIVDQEQERGPQTLRPYRWRPEGYEAIPLDSQGRWNMEAWQLYLFLRGEQLIFQDAETGKELGNYSTVSRQLEQADRKLQENETVMEQLVE